MVCTSSAGTRGETARRELRSRSFLHASFVVPRAPGYLLRLHVRARARPALGVRAPRGVGGANVPGAPGARTHRHRRARPCLVCAPCAGGGRALGGALSAGARTCSVALACRCGTAPLRPRPPRHWRTRRASIAPPPAPALAARHHSTWPPAPRAYYAITNFPREPSSPRTLSVTDHSARSRMQDDGRERGRPASTLLVRFQKIFIQKRARAAGPRRGCAGRGATDCRRGREILIANVEPATPSKLQLLQK